MTEQEQFAFVGTMTKAASRLRIYGRFQENYFVWFDPTTVNKWKTPPGPDKKTILFNACLSLQRYLAPWNPPKTT